MKINAFILGLLLGIMIISLIKNGKVRERTKVIRIPYSNEKDNDEKDNVILEKKVMRVNIPSRGPVPEFTQLGYLSQAEPIDDDLPYVLALYGRPTYRGSNNWNYHTEYNGVRIPMIHKGKNCGKNRGCDEIFEGDSFHIPSFNKDYTLTEYDTSLKYIPFV
tara:strand:+ start:108 stop:593 length:486 start_codon:yes stop_codon:yes gene_type:complete